MPAKAMKVTEEDVNRLKTAGVQIEYGALSKDEYTLRETARICDLAEAWVRTQLVTGKIAGYKKKVGNRSIWTVKVGEVNRVRKAQHEKLLERAKRPKDGKKYVYRRPTEWAYHLMVKAIKADVKLTAPQRKVMLTAMERYKGQWERAYQVRLAKKAAKAAEEAKK